METNKLKRIAYYLLVILVGIISFLVAQLLAKPPPPVAAAPVVIKPVYDVTLTRSNMNGWVAGPGRVEPRLEKIPLGADLNGRLDSVLVDTGSQVKRGQVLAVLANADYQAEVSAAEAQVREKEAALRKIVNGARPEEKAEAAALVKEMEAGVDCAKAEMDRRLDLLKKESASPSEADRYVREYKMARARCDAVVQRHALLTADAREEDRTQAEAALAFAKAQLAVARARLEKTSVRAPIDGLVLRRCHQAGESVSGSLLSPDPIFILGDRSRLRVRADIDEADVARIRLGQKAYVTAKAYGGKNFQGKVVQVGLELGKKNVFTEEPSERQDTRILEVLIELDEGLELPIGLRVDAFIETGGA